ncbi:MAG: Gfo/Idh/MocA family oxidoreductase [Bacteroidales bacterium]|jgi:predicted dehydrogenase|nr:Gfo/Idh/MocA family oxidoreductase [Bacteroidales bacterium]
MKNNKKPNEKGLSRRSFLSNATLLGAGGVLGTGSLLHSCSGTDNNKITPLRPLSEIYIPDLPDKAIDGKPIKAALIGCGSRGTGAAVNFLNAGNDVSIVACADLFKDKVDSCRKILKEKNNNEVADDMCFTGFEAYKKACELPVDVILIATPNLFHPYHLKYAVDQGKHVFVEKPACVDTAGYKTFLVAVKQAQSKGQSVLTGTQYHHDRPFVESYQKIQEGYIGQIVSGSVFYNTTPLTPVTRQPGWTDMEYMIRDFFSWNWLCGDMILDQLIHWIDVFVWFSHLKPSKVIATGSRIFRTAGDIYDNFGINFEFEGGVTVSGICRQMYNCDNYRGAVIQGTKGSWDSKDFTIRDLNGNEIWKYDAAAAKEKYKTHDMYTLEHVDFISNIRKGKLMNNAETTAISSIAAIMARESAYTGKTITWDQINASTMNLMPEKLALENVDMSKYNVIPLPGQK